MTPKEKARGLLKPRERTMTTNAEPELIDAPIGFCLHNREMTRGAALVDKRMDCKNCIRKNECRDRKAIAKREGQ